MLNPSAQINIHVRADKQRENRIALSLVVVFVL